MRLHVVYQTFLFTISSTLKSIHPSLLIPWRWQLLVISGKFHAAATSECSPQPFSFPFPTLRLPCLPSKLTQWPHTYDMQCGRFNSPWYEPLTSERGDCGKSLLSLHRRLSWQEFISHKTILQNWALTLPEQTLFHVFASPSFPVSLS
jgi:hypothetical protein